MSTPETAAVLAHFRGGDAWRNLSWELAERFPNVPEAEREDRLQQAFVIALEKCRATDRGGVYDFLRTAARRELLHVVNSKAHSTRHADPEFDFDALASMERDPLDQVLHAERIAAITTCVDELSERRRAVLIRRLCNGESRAEIAEALGASLKTVKTQLEHAARDFHRAVRRTAGSTCEEQWEEQVARLAFGAYEPDEAPEVRLHLEQCPTCDAYHDNLRWIATAAAAMLPLPAVANTPLGGLALIRHPLQAARRLGSRAWHAATGSGSGGASAVGSTSGAKMVATLATAAAVTGAGYGAHAAHGKHPAHHVAAPAPAAPRRQAPRSHPASLPTHTPRSTAHEHQAVRRHKHRTRHATAHTTTTPTPAPAATPANPAKPAAPKRSSGSSSSGEFF